MHCRIIRGSLLLLDVGPRQRQFGFLPGLEVRDGSIGTVWWQRKEKRG